jgi:hypothetical protein
MRPRSTTGNHYNLPDSQKPLGVPVKTACRLVGVGNTTMWALIRAGRINSNLPATAEALRDLFAKVGKFFDRGVPVRIITHADGTLPCAEKLTNHYS